MHAFKPLCGFYATIWLITRHIHTQKLLTQSLLAFSADGKVFAVWRPVLLSEHDSRTIPDTELLQRLITLTDSAKCWAVILSKGGHFSATIFDLCPTPPSQHSKSNALLFKDLAHKSFHRYVVRYALQLPVSARATHPSSNTLLTRASIDMLSGRQWCHQCPPLEISSLCFQYF